MQAVMLGAVPFVGLGLGLGLGLLWGLGAVVGGLLGYANFRWIRFTVIRLIENQAPGALAFIYLFKFLLLAALLVGLVFVLGLPPLALVAGLSVMPLGIVVGGLFPVAASEADSKVNL